MSPSPIPSGNPAKRQSTLWPLASLLLFVVATVPSRIVGSPPDRSTDLVWIKGGTLIDGTGHPPLRQARILLRGDRILKVGRAATLPRPKGARVVRAGGLTILPGLIDAHVHVMWSGVVAYTFHSAQPQDGEVFLRNLRAELLGGVTLVRDLNITLDVAHRLSAVVTKHPTLGARLVYAGPILTPPGGYASPSGLLVATPEEARRRVEELAREGAGVIKIAVTSRQIGGPSVARMAPEVARSVVEAAHRRGLPVAAHVAGAGADDLRVAIEAGVDSLEHMPGVSDPTRPADTFYSSAGLIPLLLDKGITVVPTLSVEAGEDFGPTLGNLAIDPVLIMRLSPVQRQILHENVEEFRRDSRRQAIAAAGRGRLQSFLAEVGRLHEAGVRIGAGSDAGGGFTFHGNLYTEIEYLHRGGLSALEAITAATRGNAELLRISNNLGTVEEGKLADLLLVEGDPLADLGALHRVERVFIAGRIVEVRRLLRDAVRGEKR